MKKVKVAVAMSGGVDSSTAAYLLKEQGFEVVGITMQLWPIAKSCNDNFRGHNLPTAAEEAKSVASKLSISHHALDFSDVFKKKVVTNFCEEYRNGRTPNPCVRCNQHIKFGLLLKKAKELGADFLATGHYAGIVFDENKKKYLLKKGVDRKKDQSYVLYTLTQEKLAHVLMPLGEITKDKAQRIAKSLNLGVTEKKESQEICFVAGKSYRDYFKDELAHLIAAGPIINKEGDALGTHKGVVFYTIGQRKGLGVAHSRPLYVIKIDKNTNTLVVGEEEDTYKSELVACDMNWVAEVPKASFCFKTKIRYNTHGAYAKVMPLDDDKVKVTFKEPQRAVAPGQAAVFYDNDVVVGGGTILTAN